MGLSPWFVLVPAVVCVLACASGGRGSRAPGQERCDLTTRGPLIQYSYQTTQVPGARGGVIEDGVYDLTRMVDSQGPSGDGSSDPGPAHRWALRFTTDERSQNHSEGAVMMVVDLPPARQCYTGRFATVDTQLRMQTAPRRDLSVQDYTATPGGLMIFSDDITYVFQRR